MDDPSVRVWLLTWTTYGTWLPGDERGFVGQVKRDDDRRIRRNRIGEEFDRAMPGLERASAAFLKGKPNWLTGDQARVTLDQLLQTADYRGWVILAIAVMSNHVHVALRVVGDPDPENILRDFKSYASRSLNKSFGRPLSGTWWTESGSKRKLPSAEAVVGGVRYVRDQARPLASWVGPLAVDTGG
ncbi:Transposase IS200 like protein [Caulifigura coniformis]|uniref:Transposase IS200 like protein n=1 Tax=Caulifigura coniformis TaxID=2527983 RepID=A0A517SGK7_9PLAN|nr:transposase [Caulifigura coniformis]QDT55240.1 Transposase IS200 like protein [Caulifigura coniformis]